MSRVLLGTRLVHFYRFESWLLLTRSLSSNQGYKSLCRLIAWVLIPSSPRKLPHKEANLFSFGKGCVIGRKQTVSTFLSKNWFFSICISFVECVSFLWQKVRYLWMLVVGMTWIDPLEMRLHTLSVNVDSHFVVVKFHWETENTCIRYPRLVIKILVC